MDLDHYNDANKFRAFLVTFKDKVSLWYINLKLITISTFIEFIRLFVTHFSTKVRLPNTVAHLITLK